MMRSYELMARSADFGTALDEMLQANEGVISLYRETCSSRGTTGIP
jgi:hypothetical protein